MTDYEFALKKEVLWEQGAELLGDLFRYQLRHGIPAAEKNSPISTLYGSVWRAKQDSAVLDAEELIAQVEDVYAAAGEVLGAMEEIKAAGHMSDEDHEDGVFAMEDVRRIVQTEADLAERRCGTQNPRTAVLLAGQPGSGKTMLASLAVRSLDRNAVFLSGDDWRRYHPDYPALCETCGANVFPLLSPFSGCVTEEMISELSDRGLGMVIEGTGRTVEVPKKTAELLSEKGYDVSMMGMAVRPELSLISTLRRYYMMCEKGIIARPTAAAAHDGVVKALPGNLDEIRRLPCVQRLCILDRKQNLLFDSRTDGETLPSEVLRDFWSSPWTAEELERAREDIRWLRRAEERWHRNLREQIEEAARRVEAAVPGI